MFRSLFENSCAKRITSLSANINSVRPELQALLALVLDYYNATIVISVYMHLQKGRLDHLRQTLGATLVWRTYILDTFRTTSISQDYLDKIRADLAAAESASFTLVIRFCYIFEMVSVF
jgi:hypothetical protein